MTNSEGPLLSHAKLDVYRRSIDLLTIVAGILDAMPKGQTDLSDQLRRAALSIPLNIAEGVGRTSTADKRRHFSIARGSAIECAAILDVAEVLRLTDRETAAKARDLTTRVVAMLTRLAVAS